MNLTKGEIVKLQEELIIIYKTIHQDRMADSFYFKGLESRNSSSQLINKINELEDPEGTLKACIIELEEIKENKKLKMEKFNEIMDQIDISILKKKYNIKKISDIDRMDIKELLKIL